MTDDKKKQPTPKPVDEQEKPVDDKKKEPEEEVWDGPKFGEAPKIIDRDDEMYIH